MLEEIKIYIQLARTCEHFTSTFNCTSLVTKAKKERLKIRGRRDVMMGGGKER